MGRERHVILISGKDSLATAIVQRRRQPNLPYEFVFNNTGWDLPETLEWIDSCSSYFDVTIKFIGDDLDRIVEEQGMLPSPKVRFCTRLAKIAPTRDYLGRKRKAFVYYGLRADEPERVGLERGGNIIPVYPLRELGIGIEEVWSICENSGLLPPAFHWQWMENRVLELIHEGFGFFSSNPNESIELDRLQKLPPWNRRSLFAWRTRNNCDRCFYARSYEYVGLLEHHPDRFWAAVKQEESNLDRRNNPFYFNLEPLRKIAERADEIKEKRARKILRFIRSPNWYKGEALGDELEITSCGLLCGK